MSQYIPIKIDIYDYLIDLHGNTWTDSGLPVSKMTTWKHNGEAVLFRLHICEVDKYGIRTISEYAFVTGKKVTVEFMGKTYNPGDSDFELTRLHQDLETEIALASLEA